MTPLPPPPEPPTEQRPPETAEHWRRVHRGLRRGVLVAGGFLLGALAALAVVFIDPTGTDTPKRPATVTRTETVAKTRTVTTERPITVPDVFGEDPNRAADELRAAGYSVAVNKKSLVCSIDATLCKVSAQDPPSGTELPAGSEVTIAIDAR